MSKHQNEGYVATTDDPAYLPHDPQKMEPAQSKIPDRGYAPGQGGHKIGAKGEKQSMIPQISKAPGMLGIPKSKYDDIAMKAKQGVMTSTTASKKINTAANAAAASKTAELFKRGK